MLNFNGFWYNIEPYVKMKKTMYLKLIECKLPMNNHVSNKDSGKFLLWWFLSDDNILD